MSAEQELIEAIQWALGERGDFEPPAPKPGKKVPPFWWRGELRQRAGLQYNSVKGKSERSEVGTKATADQVTPPDADKARLAKIERKVEKHDGYATLKLFREAVAIARRALEHRTKAQQERDAARAEAEALKKGICYHFGCGVNVANHTIVCDAIHRSVAEYQALSARPASEPNDTRRNSSSTTTHENPPIKPPSPPPEAVCANLTGCGAGYNGELHDMRCPLFRQPPPKPEPPCPDLMEAARFGAIAGWAHALTCKRCGGGPSKGVR